LTRVAAKRLRLLKDPFKDVDYRNAMMRNLLFAAVVLAPLLGAASPERPPAAPPGVPSGELRIEVANLRNGKGMLLICLSASARYFPDCGADPAARTLRVPASRAGALTFGGVAPGEYALSVMHDENNNAKLDTLMSIPREGFGFSRNPAVRFGPPRYGEVRFAMTRASMSIPIRMKYFL